MTENQQANVSTTASKPNFKKYWADRVKGFETSVWAEFTPLAQKHGAVNLGQGFPDFRGAEFILEGAKEAIDNVSTQQYSRSQGHIRLVKALSNYYSPLFGRNIDPMTEIVTTVGATEALFATIQTFIGPGDEMILIEPFYDSYPSDIIISGGIPKYVPLRYEPSASNTNLSSSDWKIYESDIRKSITDKTKMILINNPQNIPGKVYTKDELEMISRIAIEHDLLVISDEVYDAMVYNDHEGSLDVSHNNNNNNNGYTRIATLPGMWDRTLSIGSAGKSFSVTGFKVGWVIGNKELIDGIFLEHQNIPFCVSTPMQEAVAIGFEKVLTDHKNYFPDLLNMYKLKRDKLCDILKSSGLEPIKPQGAYFVLADTSRIPDDILSQYGSGSGSNDNRRDYKVCRWLTKEIGVAAIPPSAFATPQNAKSFQNLARFCFCKKDETLDEAGRRLLKIREYIK